MDWVVVSFNLLCDCDPTGCIAEQTGNKLEVGVL